MIPVASMIPVAPSTPSMDMDDDSPISESDSGNEPGLDFSDTSFMAQMFCQLNELRKRGQFCDVTLIVEEHEATVHRSVLASASTVFYDMFTKGDDEGKTQDVFKLKDIKWTIFSYLLDFIYTGRLSVPSDHVKAVYNCSKYLRLSSATQACAQYLASCLTPDNCLGIRSCAVDDALRERINQYVSENIREVTNSKKFYGLSRISMEIVGTNENLISKTSHDELLPEVLVWLKQQLSNKKNNFSSLLEDMYVLYLNADNSLTDCNDVDDTNLIDNELVQDYKKLTRKKQSGKPKETSGQESSSNGSSSLTPTGLNNYRKFNLNPDSPKSELEWSIVASYKMKDRTYTVIAMMNGNLVTISVHYRPAVSGSSGAEDPDSPTSNGYSKLFDRYADLMPLEGMSTNRCAFGLKALDGKLFACGGYDRGECLKSCEVYEFEKNKWTVADDMKSVRGRFSIAFHDNNIYACGGSSGNSDVRTVECYNAELGKWSIITEAIQAKASPGNAVLDNKLYVIGGCIGQSTVATCDTFDLNTKVWSRVASMQMPRFQVAVTVFKNKIYAIGGTNGWKCLAEVEVYDPHTNTWSVFLPMNIARRGAGVDVYNGKIYVVGGNDGTTALNSTEIYDPETHTWSLGPTLSSSRANCGVAAMGTKLFAVGGFNGKKFLASMEFLDVENSEYWCSQLPTKLAEKIKAEEKKDNGGEDSKVVENGVGNGLSCDVTDKSECSCAGEKTGEIAPRAAGMLAGKGNTGAGEGSPCNGMTGGGVKVHGDKNS